MCDVRSCSMLLSLVLLLLLPTSEGTSRRCVPTGNANNDSICVPVCCGPDNTYKYNMTTGTYECDGTKSNNYFWEVYNSNLTHIDTNSTMQNVSVYHQPLSCPKWRYLLSPDSEFSLGFIWNSSFILVDVAQRQISLVPPSNYCIEFRETLKNDASSDALIGPIFSVCGEGKVKSSTVKAHLYFGLLIISTVSYFVSAGCYLFFLKVKDIHRKCFVAYSISMGLTFLFLVLLQQWQAKCYTLGFFFFLFIMNGFLWLTILCVDLALELWYFERSAAKERWFWYIGACLTVPPFILFASVIPDWVPDIPDTFIINFGNDVESMCSFKESTNYFFFLPIGIMMGISLAALCTSVHAIRVNNKNFSNHFPWLDTRGSYKYMSTRVYKSATIFSVMLLFFVIKLMLNVVPMEGNFITSLQICESVSGCLILAVVISTWCQHSRDAIDRDNINNNVSNGNGHLRDETELESLNVNVRR